MHHARGRFYLQLTISQPTAQTSTHCGTVSQRTTTAASQWCHSGIAVVPYYQHPLDKISLSTKITALSKSL